MRVCACAEDLEHAQNDCACQLGPMGGHALLSAQTCRVHLS